MEFEEFETGKKYLIAPNAILFAKESEHRPRMHEGGWQATADIHTTLGTVVIVYDGTRNALQRIADAQAQSKASANWHERYQIAKEDLDAARNERTELKIENIKLGQQIAKLTNELNDLQTEFAMAQVALGVAGITYTVNTGRGAELAAKEIP